MSEREKLRSVDIQWLVYVPVIIGIAVCMAFCEDKQLPHLAGMAFAWSVMVIVSGKIRLDIGDALIFSGMFLFMWIFRGWFFEGLANGLMLTFVYQTGKYIAGGLPDHANAAIGNDRMHTDAVTRVMYMVTALATALFARALLNYDYTVKWKRGKKVFTFGARVSKDFYDQTIVRTMQAFYLVLIASLLIFFIYILRRSIAVGVMGIILSCTAIWLDVLKKGRMVACCAIVTFAVVLVMAGIEKKLYRRRWIRITAAAAAAGLVAFIIAVSIDLFGLHDLYENSFWVRDGGVFGNVRFQIMRNALMEMMEHPFSGSGEALFATSKEAISSMAHNSWLDIGMQSGIVPFVLTVGFTVTNIISLFYVWKKCPDGRKYVLIAGFAGVTLYNMFEPAILNCVLFWNAEVFLGGLANGLSGTLPGRKREFIISLRDQTT